jgi:hypothetical protein
MKFKYTTIQDWPKTFIEAVAREESALLSSPISPGVTISTSAESQTHLQEPSKKNYSSSINVKSILQVHFFEKVLKEGADINKLWPFIDDRKLHNGITDIIHELQRSKQEHQNECLQKVDDTITIDPNDCDTAKYPALQKFAVPLVNSTMHSSLCDIVALNDNCGNLLTFQAFDRKPCTLVNPVSSSSYIFFNQNIQQTKWMDSLLLAICNDKEATAEWIMHFMGKRYVPKFNEVAVDLGLLLPSKVIDAESAYPVRRLLMGRQFSFSTRILMKWLHIN